MVETAEESGATIGAHPGGVTEILTATAADIDNLTEAERKASITTATQRHLAVAFLLGADKLRHGTLVEEIENEFLHNKGSLSTAGTYPTMVAEACDCLSNYKKDPKNLARLFGHDTGGDSLNTGVAFVQDGNKEDENQEQAFTTHSGGGGNHKGNNNQSKAPKVCRCCGSVTGTIPSNAILAKTRSNCTASCSNQT
jgi:hypothetical protein